jgi:hypothetical protein
MLLPVTGPGILARYHVPARAPALTPVQAQYSEDVVAAPACFQFLSEEMDYGYARADKAAAA